jgi:hypothetical protein
VLQLCLHRTMNTRNIEYALIVVTNTPAILLDTGSGILALEANMR